MAASMLGGKAPLHNPQATLPPTVFLLGLPHEGIRLHFRLLFVESRIVKVVRRKIQNLFFVTTVGCSSLLHCPHGENYSGEHLSKACHVHRVSLSCELLLQIINPM